MLHFSSSILCILFAIIGTNVAKKSPFTYHDIGHLEDSTRFNKETFLCLISAAYASTTGGGCQVFGRLPKCLEGPFRSYPDIP